MLYQSLRAATNWAVALAAMSVLTLTDPPANGERALLGRTPACEACSSNLRMVHSEGRVSAGRALLGELTAGEKQCATGEAIQIRSRRADGPGALLGQP
jgi:hypothetical protein